MARIIQTQEQVEALKSVKNDLKNLKNINSFIEQTNISEADNITFSANIGGSVVKIPLDRKTVIELLDKQKRKMQKDISTNASRFCIMLDDTDKEILEQ
ncbi:MAG: hypothetical protein J1F01_00725 [Oscillospiraceae bacterium]|nr:hypothetical protein [Oscillospiraceae bacterium]